MNGRSPWIALAVLGAFHGINPAMGWLFAVARGLQEGRRREVLRSLLPIAVGHEAAIALVVVLVAGAGLLAAPVVLRILGAVVLVGFGAYKLIRPRHPRWVGMRISEPELAVWSFLMSTAHGAGLMLFPILVGGTLDGHEAADETVHTASAFTLTSGAAAVTVHVAAMLAVMGVVALIVYQKIGLRFLRRGWVNLDRVWAVALVGAGIFTMFT